jgi:nucleotide-binding universal stress UspA family protein
MSAWKTVLVGVDGSTGSRAALTWAANEAADHGADLVVVHVWEPQLIAAIGSGSVPHGPAADSPEEASGLLVGIVTEELGENPPVRVQPRVKRGHPAEVLIDESKDADLLVVGTRGRGGFAGLVLGSVSQHVAAYARCPVTVVR